ncbi:MAG: hypothetical protein F4117_08505 [Acidimicrobiales bacterium]|nr:hypothetical protein [Acidimicrobiales bacterium]MYB80129.1 hypothetical protein [Acidimicrobiales bacterium]MYI12592.1 hypothetical protein [Acidimicrobiales bacterium]
MNEPSYDVVWPGAPSGIEQRELAPRLDTLAGKRIGLLWDYLFRGDELFPILERELAARYEGVTFVGYETFGNTHGGDEAAVIDRLPDSLRSRAVDAVVSGMGC